MASRANEMPDEPTKPDFSSFKPDAEALKPKMPTFEDYFKAEADGIHPFDSIKESFDESEELNGGRERDEAELEREKHLYHRELLGKLIGHNLTPAEYEIIAGVQEDARLRQKRQLDSNNEEFLSNRHNVDPCSVMKEQVVLRVE